MTGEFLFIKPKLTWY